MKKFWNKIKQLFGRNSTFQKVLEQALKTLVTQAGPIAIDLLASVALSKVREVDGHDLPNYAKRSIVMESLKDTAIRQGIQVSASVLNLILETAVNAHKNK